MQGTLTVDRFPIRQLVMALIASSVLILGGLGGYLIRGDAQSTAPREHDGRVSASATSSPSLPAGPAFDDGSRRSGNQY
jgi:hypothetical protein